MALEIGIHQVKIKRSSIQTFGDKDAVVLNFETAAGDEGRALIFLTPKSMGVARKSLKIAGFDCDARKLTDLLTVPDLLADNMMPVMVEEWNGKIRAQVHLDSVPDTKQIDKYQDMLRKAKKDGEPEAEDIPF